MPSTEKSQNIIRPASRLSLKKWLAVASFACVACHLACRQLNDYVVCSEDIYTVDASSPRVDCILIHSSTGRIGSTGTLDDVRNAWFGHKLWTGWLPFPLKTIYTPPGAIVVPGLADAHAHITEYGMAMQLDLAGSTSIDDVLGRLKRYVESHPDIRDDKTLWIEGMGWDQTKWDPPIFPTLADFDREPVLAGRPILLDRIDVHASWVSSKVLDLIGHLPETVEGGLIVRDNKGVPTGILVDKAMDLIPRPPITETRMLEYFHRTMNDALRHGLTSIHDAATDAHITRFFERMSLDGLLPLRLYVMGYSSNSSAPAAGIPRLIHHGKHSRLNVRSIKLIADGALGSWSAALLAPYTDKPSSSGLMRLSQTELEVMIPALWRDGWQVNVHCIGDRANAIVLDIFESIMQPGDADRRRPRIEHAQIFQLSDSERIGRLGVIASVQPTHATSDMWYAEQRLGSERLKGAYAYKTLLNASFNSVLPLGSDFPVEGINPLLGFYAAVTRLSLDGSSPHGEEGWYSEQKLSREDALKGMTLDAAYASFAENDIGSLTTGKRADFVILDQNIMTVEPNRLLRTKVMATVVDGKVAYGRL